MWNLKKKKKPNKLIDTENRFVVSKGEGAWTVGEMGKEVSCMVMDGN